ncbi:unnamed protein product [Urochloa decumbens]|uniref:Uncharacterized protein n=1 Tax=Urochloa decumbens TaxID=240449 RepID=A0ABC8WL37_9POAL
MAGNDLELRRSARLIRIKELSACASEPDLILMLKREINAHVHHRREERALEDRVAGKKVRPVEEEADPAGTGKKRKKVVKRKVPQGLIDTMILNPHNPWNGYREEELGKCPKKFREFYAKEKALADKVLEYEHALIKQFRTKGYAEDYTVVTDNDDEN